ncbi:MAG: histidinol-phosphatase [Mucinivorans sp.]
MPLTNYHSHSLFCDGKASIEDFVRQAISLGFSAYGVSAHSPLPFDAPWVIAWDRVDEYIAQIRDLGVKYSSQIELLAGMEIDYLDETYNASTPYFQGLDLDYRIGSVHFVRSDRDGSFVDIDCPPSDFARAVDYHFAGSLERVVRAYYNAKFAMVEAGGFDFLGHADKISMNATSLSSHIMDKQWYRDLVDEFFVFCASRSIRLEINTKAWEIKGVFFPDERYFGRLADLGVAVVVNSDAHRTERISVGLAEATSRLRAAGVERIEEFHHGIWSIKN